MGLLDDVLGKAVPGGKISKPLILALLALLASGALTRRGATSAPTAPAPTPIPGPGGQGNNPLGDLLGSLLGGGAPRGPGAPGGGSGNPLGDILGGLLGGGAGGQPPGRMRAAATESDLLGGLLGAGGGAAAGGLLGGLGSILEGMQKSGHGEVADSWVGGGENRQIAPGQLSDVLDPAVIRQLAQETGMDEDEVLSQLSQGLPDLVSGLTPEGRLPEENELSRLSRQLG